MRKKSPFNIGANADYSLGSSVISKAQDWQESLSGSHRSENEELKPSTGFVSNFMTVSAMVVCILLFSLLGLRLFYLQVMAGEQYLNLANGNRIRDDIQYAKRGNIYDRNGKLLARNTASFQLTATPYLLHEDEDTRDEHYQIIGSIIGRKPGKIKAEVEKKGLAYSLPVLIKEHILRVEAVKIESVLTSVNGFNLDSVPSREYVSDAGLAHILGYVGRVDEEDLKHRDDILPIDFIGRGGVEQSYDQILRGENGYRRTEVDALGRPIRVLANEKPRHGTDITLSIDYDLQVQLEKIVRKQMVEAGSKRASAVVMHPDTGEILAMVSIPYFDNNDFARGISDKKYKKLTRDNDQPLLNKAIGGAYPSGSIIKPIVGSAALEEKVVNQNTVIHDRGHIDIVNQYDPSIVYRFHGWRRSGLGPMNIRRAIAMSSNIYFYTVGGGHENIDGLGVDRLTKYYKAFGLGEETGVDLPGETNGRVPTPEWKEKVKGEPWVTGDTYNISIGQGDLLVSPLQITVANNSVVNNGKVVRPHIVSKVNGKKIGADAIRKKVPVKGKNLQIIREGMHEVPYNGATCSCRFTNVPVPFAGKSGTAETNKETKRKTHGWFTAYAPYKNPELMMTVMIEEGGSGSRSAAPAVSKFLEYYFTR